MVVFFVRMSFVLGLISLGLPTPAWDRPRPIGCCATLRVLPTAVACLPALGMPALGAFPTASRDSCPYIYCTLVDHSNTTQYLAATLSNTGVYLHGTIVTPPRGVIKEGITPPSVARPKRAEDANLVLCEGQSFILHKKVVTYRICVTILLKKNCSPILRLKWERKPPS